MFVNYALKTREILSHIWIIKPWSFLLFDRRRFLRYMYIPTPTTAITAKTATPTITIITTMPWSSALLDPVTSL